MNLRKFYLGRAIGFIVVVLLVLIYFALFKSRPASNVNDNNNENNIVCTTDAKECPDGSYVGRSGPDCQFTPCPELKSTMTQAEARVIAEQTCIKGGESLVPGTYNAGTKTWWFDANLNATKEGCNPACVVSEDTKTAEINWRCTGLLNENDISVDLSNWLTFEDKEQNISWLYPEKLSASFISTQTWPPKVSLSNMDYNCPVTEAGSSLPDRTMERQVDDRTYCVTATSEGAAGSVFTDYTYSRVRDGKLINISFALRYPQCDNYDDPQKSDCKGERETFDLDSVIDKIAQSVSLVGE